MKHLEGKDAEDPSKPLGSGGQRLAQILKEPTPWSDTLSSDFQAPKLGDTEFLGYSVAAALRK